jgi:hypothetical protein
LTDNVLRFANRKGTETYRTVSFDRLWQVTGIEYRLAKVNHPWTIGPIERLNRTIKKRTVQRFCDRSHHHPKQHMQTFPMAANFAQRSKTLECLSPCEYICESWTKQPARSNLDRVQHSADYQQMDHSANRVIHALGMGA